MMIMVKRDVAYKISPDGMLGELGKGGQSVKFSCLLVTGLVICKRGYWEGRQSQGMGGFTKNLRCCSLGPLP